MSDDADRKRRAAARAQWPGGKHRLGDEPDEAVVLIGLSPGEMVAMVWRLTQDAWALSGAEMPQYTRRETPGKVVRRHGRPV